MDERMRARHKLEHDMRVALREGQFELYYQPQLNLEGGEIAGFEALLRWNHPERGLVMPGEFIPLAEETGFIVALGEWGLREACEQASSWPKGVRVAVNLSVAQFRSGQVRQSVIAALGGSAIPPGRLELEITESILMQESHDVAEVLGKLQDIGVGLALDDFGTGFSSLSYLTRIRFDKIKIDKHFISELRTDPNSALAVLRSVVALARSLNITTVAEGIETKEQLDACARRGARRRRASISAGRCRRARFRNCSPPTSARRCVVRCAPDTVRQRSLELTGHGKASSWPLMPSSVVSKKSRPMGGGVSGSLTGRCSVPSGCNVGAAGSIVVLAEAGPAASEITIRAISLERDMRPPPSTSVC